MRASIPPGRSRDNKIQKVYSNVPPIPVCDHDGRGPGKKFLEVFSEEFTDKILSQAVADRDLIEHNDNIYVAYKKNDGEVSYNSWMHHVEDDGNGNFTVVMAVRKRSVDDIIYVKLPTGKSGGKVRVYPDYPYWDKSK